MSNPLYILRIRNGKERTTTIKKMGTAELFSLYEQLAAKLDWEFAPETLRRAEVLNTLLQINKELAERFPGNRSLGHGKQLLFDKLAITTRIVRQQKGGARSTSRRRKKRTLGRR